MSKGSGGGGNGSRGAKAGGVSAAGGAFAGLRHEKWNDFAGVPSESSDASAMARSEQLSSKISGESHAALQMYSSGGGFEGIKAADAGRGGTAADKRMASLINSALSKAPKSSQTVYRGMAVNKATLQSIMRHKEIRLDSLSSASRAPSIARRFVSDNAKKSGYKAREYGVIMKVKTRSGVSIDSISHHKHEREVVMAKGTRLKIDRMTRTTVTTWEGKSPTLVIHAHEI